MKTLLVPCAGKSSRFPNMKPKWMLTHPDGKLMVEKSIEGLNLKQFDRFIITIVKEVDEKYDAALILKQAFVSCPNFELCILDSYTESQSHTVTATIHMMKITGELVVKDSDNYVECTLPNDGKSAIVGVNLKENQNITNIPAKSFLIINHQNIVEDIFEKNVVSNTICVGTYIFSDVSLFLDAFEHLTKKLLEKELYLSHVIAYMIAQKIDVFHLINAVKYEDWGTLKEWRACQKNHSTYFVDVDGVLLKNTGKYGKVNWSNNTEVLSDNLILLKSLYDQGAQIVITTSRSEDYKEFITSILNEFGIIPHEIITNLNHASRIIINDFAPTNPYPSAQAINIIRNGSIKEYIGN